MSALICFVLLQVWVTEYKILCTHTRLATHIHTHNKLLLVSWWHKKKCVVKFQNTRERTRKRESETVREGEKLKKITTEEKGENKTCFFLNTRVKIRNIIMILFCCIGSVI